MSNRRETIKLISGMAIAYPLAANAEQHVRRVGMLNNNVASDSSYQQYVAGFVETLRNLGWAEGRNLRLDIRWNSGDASLARTYGSHFPIIAT